MRADGVESKRRSKTPGLCVFCGRRGLTKEHVYAAWIGKLIKPKHNRTVHILTDFDPSVKKRLIGFRRGPHNRQGSTLVRKLRIVCKNCNNEWMSRLQSSAKPRMSQLISGDWSELKLGDVAIIAAWVTMTTMVLEFKDPDRVAWTREERRRFKETLIPPLNTHVWLGKYNGLDSEGASVHRAIKVFDKQTQSIDDVPVNCQVTKIHLGKLFILCFSFPKASSPDYLVPRWIETRFGLQKIWPISLTSLTVARQGDVDDVKSEQILDCFGEGLSA